MSAKQRGWWDLICEKRKQEADDGENELEEARMSRNLFDLVEQMGQAEATAARLERAKTSEEQEWKMRKRADKQERAEQTGEEERSSQAKRLQGEKELGKSIQDIIIFIHGQ